MTDLENRLRADGAAWQRLVDAGARAVEPAIGQVPRRRWLAPALSAAAVVAVALTLALVSRSSSPGPAPSAAGHWRTHAFAGLTLRHPAGWLALHPFTGSQGPVSSLGYLVSERDIEACPAHPDGFCGNPVPRLIGDASVVSATSTISGRAFTPNTTIDGRPARFAHDRDCEPGGRYGATVTFRSGHEFIQVRGCTASTDPAAHHVIDRILTTLRYVGGPLATITGRFREIGGPAPGIDETLPGTITVRRVGGGLTVVRHVAANGRYTVDVPAGRYTVIGRSPRILGRKAECAALHEPIVASTAVRADVICPIN